MSATPKVSIILLNWNQPELTAACLHTLERLSWPNVEVVVVDNGSQDDSVPKLRSAFPWAVVVEAHSNLGFTGGNNGRFDISTENDLGFLAHDRGVEVWA